MEAQAEGGAMMPDGASYRDILDNLSDGIYVVDPRRTITFWNKTAERITGYSSEEVLGSPCAHNFLRHVDGEGRLLCQQGCPLSAVLSGAQSLETDVYLHHKDGHRVPVRVRTAPLRGSTSAVVGAIASFRDNTQAIAVIQRLNQLEKTALLDPLTGLANRRFLQQHLQDCFDLRRRYGWHFGLMYLDIDHFKLVNDTYGHEAGDEVLKSLSRTLAGNVRSFDLIGRWGGEEFLVVCPNVGSADLQAMAERHRMLIESSTAAFHSETLRVTVSVGATLPRLAESMESLIRRADSLLYESKRQGRNRVTFAT
jgi:diguanylate cyclase (GGDEF)-like protein/PAS domain S-box-containing protein